METPKGLTALLKQEKPDITVSMFCNEVSFLTNIKDGSRKVLEIHFSKYKRLQYGRKGLWRLADRWFSIQEEKWVKRFDKFVVLTKEDQGYWGDLPNITVIPNALPETEGEPADMHSHRVLAVGRLDYQKGFERLVEAWEEVKKDKIFNDWRLDIFGKGECQDMLQQMIDERDLQDCLFLNQPTTAILDEYKKSSLLVMSSRYEGFPMVLLEAMSAGLPVVSFDCKCGPKDMIQDGRNGLLVKEGDISGLANAMKRMMAEVNFRICLSKEARKVSEYYSETIVMQQWKDLFETICRK